MSISVPSRFACLSLEDEEQRPKTKIAKNVKPKTIVANKTSKSNGKTSSSKKTRQKAKVEEAQWEEWKKKDDELVNDNFEQDLKSALFQSKIDFEKQKQLIVISNKPAATKKKKKTMSLDEFLSDNKKQNNSKDVKPVKEEDFFEKFVNTTDKEIKKELIERKRKEREVNIDEIVTLAQCQEKLNCERLKNKELAKELEEARNEIVAVKKRNTTLYKMLSQGEMKDKAAVLLELERLTTVKEELSEEVNRLHKLLEQERSNKSNNTTDTHNSKHKDKQKHKKH